MDPARSSVEDITLTNPSRQAMRVMLVLGCVFLGLAAIALMLQSVDPARFAMAANTPAAGICLIVLAAGGPSAVAMFLSALITLRPALVTDRIFDQFRRGEMLADWRFTGPEWDRYVAAEAARLDKTSPLVWLWLVGPSAGVAAFVLWQVYPSVLSRAENLVVVAVCAGCALWLLRQAQAAFLRRRIATLRRNPRVLIGNSSIYCGGFFKPWNVSMLVLQRARLLPGPPMMLEVTIGPGQVAQAAGTVLAVASLAGGGVGGGAFGTMRSQMLVPVPADKHDDAARVIQDLVSPSPATIVPARISVAPTSVRPEQPRRRWHWWTMTAVMFVVGFILLLIGGKADDAAEAGRSSMGMAASVVGLFLWIGGLITGIIAVTVSIRSYLSRARTSTGLL